MMKIAIDISPLESKHYLQHKVRGTGFYIENLKKSLVRYCPENKYIFFTRGKNLLDVFAGTQSSLQELPKDVDVIHYPYYEPFFLTLPLRNKNKTVVTVHDLAPFVFPQHFPAGIKGNLKWQIQKQGLKNANAIITDSLSSKKDIIKYAEIKEEKINVIYLAAGEEFKKVQSISANWRIKVQSLRIKYNLPQEFALYVGDATWNKNLIRLVDAVSIARVSLVMVGKALFEEDIDKNNKWNEDLIKTQEIANNNENIIRLGFVPIEDLVKIYNLAKLFIMPSLYEGFGLPALEAMSCGCPVILSREGSLPEVGGNAVYYVDAYSTENIAKGIKEVYSNLNLQKELSVKSLVQAQKFSWEKTAKETLRVYKKALKE